MSPAGFKPKRRALRLRLFVAGEAPNSVAALRNLRAALAAHPAVDAELEVVDVLKRPDLALRENVLVTPTMIKLDPTPMARILAAPWLPEKCDSVSNIAAGPSRRCPP